MDFYDLHMLTRAAAAALFLLWMFAPRRRTLYLKFCLYLLPVSAALYAAALLTGHPRP